MRYLILPAAFLAGFFVFSPARTFAQQAPAASFVIQSTFDYPEAGISTLPEKINDRGEIVGILLDPVTFVNRGFFRRRSGIFSPPLIEPDDTAGLTQARGINNARVICGSFAPADGAIHGFLLERGVYTDVDFEGVPFTNILDLNDAGDFVGSYGDEVLVQAFAFVLGNVVTFAIPGSARTAAYSINNLGQIVGQYLDAASLSHGFFRDTDGTLIYPIDPPGASQTFLFGINDSGQMVGRYVDPTLGMQRAFLFELPGDFSVFDYPGAILTSFNGINRRGLICGRYRSPDGVQHGLLVRVSGATAADVEGSSLTLPFSPPLSSPQSISPLEESPLGLPD